MLTKSTTCEIPDPYGYPEETYTPEYMRKMCDDSGLCQWFMNTRMCEGRDLRTLCCPPKSSGRFGSRKGEIQTVSYSLTSQTKVLCALMLNTIQQSHTRHNVKNNVHSLNTGIIIKRVFMIKHAKRGRQL